MSKSALSERPVVFLKSMPKGGVFTGKVFTLPEAVAQRYDANPSVLATLLKQMKELKVEDLEGNIQIRHPKGYVLGLWNGALSTLDPEQSMPDLAGVTKPNP